jgi:hypothetical protein
MMRCYWYVIHFQSLCLYLAVYYTSAFKDSKEIILLFGFIYFHSNGCTEVFFQSWPRVEISVETKIEVSSTPFFTSCVTVTVQPNRFLFVGFQVQLWFEVDCH